MTVAEQHRLTDLLGSAPGYAAQFKEWVASLKKRSCKDCRRKFHHACMDFDHVRGKKLFQIGREGPGKGRAAVLREIKKCDLVCANCHRLRTWKRWQRRKR